MCKLCGEVVESEDAIIIEQLELGGSKQLPAKLLTNCPHRISDTLSGRSGVLPEH